MHNMQYISDQNMIKAINYLKKEMIIPYKRAAYEVMGLDEQRVYKIENPERFKNKQGHHFSAEHIRLFCEKYGINSNFIYDFEPEILRKNILPLCNKKHKKSTE